MDNIHIEVVLNCIKPLTDKLDAAEPTPEAASCAAAQGLPNTSWDLKVH
jgi:hypothetical protein